jgi:hypothetical protein
VQNTTAELLAQLRERHPLWDCWVVWRAVGGPLWCARPLASGDDARDTIQADSPGELAALMRLFK